MAGEVLVDGRPGTKAGQLVAADAKIELKTKACPFVGRGGLKLAEALKKFQIDPAGRICLDIGASTGGFTDCLLKNGAAAVIAVDCGRGQLDWKLRQDQRVVCLEKTNARYLTPADLAEKVTAAQKKTLAKPPAALPPDWAERLDLAVIDVSFISLALILPPVVGLLSPRGRIVALIKPQFEAGPAQVGRGGIVRDPQIHEQVIAKVKAAAEKNRLRTAGLIPSPISGADGNKEFLIYLTKA